MGIKGSTSCRDAQAQRLQIKGRRQQMSTLAVQGAGLSPWEADVLVDTVEEVYFTDPLLEPLKPGMVRHCCVASDEGPGKPLSKCRMVTVTLTLFDEQDTKHLHSSSGKNMSVEMRQRRLARIAEEAREQGGYLTQEDLALLVMCDVRTVRRDIKALKQRNIVLPTRGQQQDIGPGVSHRAQAVRLWLEGKEPLEVARAIKHSLAAVESYLEKFKRVAYLSRKGLDVFENALTIGISVASARTFYELYENYKDLAFFEERLEELDAVGSAFYDAQDQKKCSILPNVSSSEGRPQ